MTDKQFQVSLRFLVQTAGTSILGAETVWPAQKFEKETDSPVSTSTHAF